MSAVSLSICGKGMDPRNDQSPKPAIRVDRGILPVLRACITVCFIHVANRPMLRVGLFAARVRALAMASRIGQRFGSANGIVLCDVSNPPACASARALTRARAHARMGVKTCNAIQEFRKWDDNYEEIWN